MLICAHSQIPFCSNKCLRKCNRINRVMSAFMGVSQLIWCWGRHPISSPTRCSLENIVRKSSKQLEFDWFIFSKILIFAELKWMNTISIQHHSTSFSIIQHHSTRMVRFIFAHSNRMRSGAVKVSALRPLHQHRSHRAIQKSLPYPRRGMFEPLKLQSFTEPTMAAKMRWVR